MWQAVTALTVLLIILGWFAQKTHAVEDAHACVQGTGTNANTISYGLQTMRGGVRSRREAHVPSRYSDQDYTVKSKKRARNQKQPEEVPVGKEYDDSTTRAVADLWNQYCEDAKNMWKDHEISPGVYHEIIYRSEIKPVNVREFKRLCKATFVNVDKTLIEHTVSVDEGGCQLVTPATDVTEVDDVPNVTEVDDVPDVLDAAESASISDAPVCEDEPSEEQNDIAAVASGSRRQEPSAGNDPMQLSPEDYVTWCRLGSCEQRDRFLSIICASAPASAPASNPESDDDNVADTVDACEDQAAAKRESKARRKAFKDAYAEEYAQCQNTPTPQKVKDLLPIWNEYAAKYPIDGEVMDLVAKLTAAKKNAKGEQAKLIKKCLRSANKYATKIYCQEPGCTSEAILTSMDEYVAFKTDPEFMPLLNEGCYGIEEVDKLFKIWCHRQVTGGNARAVVCCGEQSHQPRSITDSGKVLFNPNSSRTCMICVENASEGSDRVKTLNGSKYSMCKACTKSMNEGDDGAGEMLLERCLKPVVKHHNAMFKDARAHLLSQFMLGKTDKPIDRGIMTTMQTAEGEITVYDCIELNTLGDSSHTAANDVKKMTLSRIGCTASKTYIRWWLFPWEKKPWNMEILKRHLLRQLRLTIGVNPLVMPRLQVFLIACSDGVVGEFKRELATRISYPSSFVTTNVHVCNGCPAPIVPPERMCLVRNRDVVGLSYTMVSMLDRVDPWIMHAGLAKSNKGRTPRKVQKGGTSLMHEKNGRKYQKKTGGEKILVTPKDLQPKCTPPRLRRNEIAVSATIDYASMSASQVFK